MTLDTTFNKKISKLKHFLKSKFDKSVSLSILESDDKLTDLLYTQSNNYIDKSYIYIKDDTLVGIIFRTYLRSFAEESTKDIMDKIISLDLNISLQKISFLISKSNYHFIESFPNLISLSIEVEDLDFANTIIKMISPKCCSIRIRTKMNSSLPRDYLTHLKNLKSLSLFSEHDPQNLELLSDLIHLEHLSILNVSNDPNDLNNSDLDFILNFKNLITFKCYRLGFDSSLLRNCINLKRISISNCTSSDLTNLKQLENLNISESNDFSLNNFSIENLKSLLLIEVDNVNIDSIANAINLNHLHISPRHINNSNSNSNSNSKGNILLNNILKCRSLLSVTINSTPIIINDEDGLINHSIKILNLVNANIRNINFINYIENVNILDLSSNPISDISILTENISLTDVHLNNCNIINIPEDIIKKYDISLKARQDEHSEPTLFLKNNPLEHPPEEIILQGNSAIKSYFESMEGDTEELNEAKIIFLGDGAAGKTSLMKRLISNTFCSTEETTHGINIYPYSVPLNDDKSVSTNIWDFGGQQIMHTTHQLFLSRRCVYVLVLEDRKDDQHKDQKIEYWLQQVNSLGADSKIIIVKNKCDEQPYNNIKESILKEKFPNIVSFHSVSCKENTNIDKLKNALNAQVRQLRMRKIKLSRNWIDIKNELNELSCDHLSLRTFDDICAAHGLNDKNARNTLLKLLHDLSIVIAFKQLESFDMGILNPHWITDAIYAIINSEKLAVNNGYIKEQEVQDLLNMKHPDKYERKAHFIISAMREFELCHSVGSDSSRAYLVPDLLPTEINDNEITPGVNTINFVFKYEHLLPPSIFPKFLVRLNQDIKGNRRWRTGAILTDTELDVQAKIEEDATDKTIKIIVTGHQCREYFAIIRKTIRDLNDTFDVEKLGVDELIPLPGYESEMVSYKELIGHESERINDYFSGRLRKRFNVGKLLSGIESKEATDKSLEQLLKENKHVTHININNDNSSTLTNSSNQDQTQTQTTLQSINIAVELKGLQGTSRNVIADILDEVDLEVDVEKDKKRIVNECSKVSQAIDELQDVSTEEEAKEKVHHFSRISDFLQGVLNKENNTGRVIEMLGDSYSQAQGLARKYNSVASYFGMPTVPEILL